MAEIEEKPPEEAKGKKYIKEDEGQGFGLLDLLLPQFFIPVKGLNWISKKLYQAAETDITDVGAVQSQLLELQMRYELEEISEEEYERDEKLLLDRIEAIRQYEKEKEEAKTITVRKKR